MSTVVNFPIPDTTYLNAALEALKFGLYPIPLDASKKTAVSWIPWQNSLSEHSIKNHWEIYPSHGVGTLIDDQLIVFDADTPESLAALSKIEKKHKIKALRVVKTSKGEHHYFNREEKTFAKQQGFSSKAHPAAIDIRTAQGEGVDGGGWAMAVLPPTGGREIVRDVDHIDDLSYVDQDFIDAVFKHNGVAPPRKQKPVEKRDIGDIAIVDEASEFLSYIPADLDYQDWFNVLAALHDKFNGSEEGLQLAIEWSITTHPDKAPEVQSKWATFTGGKGRGYGTIVKMAEDKGANVADIMEKHAQITSMTTAEDFRKVLDRQEQAAKAPTLPTPFNYPPGVVGELAQWINDTSYRKQPLFALAGALSIMSHLSGNNYEVKAFGTRLNLYIMMIGVTGGGKDNPQEAAAVVAELVQDLNSVSDALASAPALLYALSRHSSLLVRMDEISGIIKAMNSQTGSGIIRELGDEFLRMYNKASGLFAGKEYASKANIDPIYRPSLNILGATTPAALMDSIKDLNIDNGLLNRFLPFRDDSRPKARTPMINGMTEPLGEKLKAIYRSKDITPMPDPMTPKAIGMENNLMEQFDQFGDDCDLKGERAIVGGLFIRAKEIAIKVAGIIAVGVDYQKPVITQEIFDFSTALVSQCLAHMADKVETENVDGVYAATAKKMLERIGKVRTLKDNKFLKWTKKGKMPHSKLLKDMSIDSRQFKQVIDTLIASEQVIATKEGKEHKETTLYALAD